MQSPDTAAPAFLGRDFLLSTPAACHLFHEVAAAMPIVDVHNHLVPEDIAGDRRWDTLAHLWLDDDHYKWRAMRGAGIDEALITGNADPEDRFRAWAATVQRLLGNPLYVWTHLELQRAFDIDVPLSPASAGEVWQEANRQLRHMTARGLLERFDVALVATTDSPNSRLQAHQDHARANATPQMVPTFRPDAAHALLRDAAAWNAWVDELAAVENLEIHDLASLLAALASAFRRFTNAGCRASDHGLARLPDIDRDPACADATVRAARNGTAASDADRERVMLEVVTAVAQWARENDSVLQLQLGPLRDVSPRLLEQLGNDAGADVMGDARQAAGLARFLADLERSDALPRTVLYNINPADNAVFVTMAGAFARPGVASLVQWGPPWWFNDHEEGMRRQLDDLAQIGQLAGFVGMLTDSRSILSMTRHELFRRILCDKLGRDVAAGRIPWDRAWLESVVRAVCADNARAFFGFASDRTRAA